MRSLGIVRKMDQLGRLVIPKETRRVFNLNEGDPVEIFTDGDKIIIKKYAQGCQCCGNMEIKIGKCEACNKMAKLNNMYGKLVCKGCKEQINKAIGMYNSMFRPGEKNKKALL